MKNPLLSMLLTVQALSVQNLTLSELVERSGESPATIKRQIADARHMGADIVSVKSGKLWTYHLLNWSNIKKIALKWIELEQQRRFF